MKPSPQIIDEGVASCMTDGAPLLRRIRADHGLAPIEGGDAPEASSAIGVAAPSDLVERTPDA